MTTERREWRARPTSLKAAALLIAYDGHLPSVILRDFLLSLGITGQVRRANGKSEGTRAGRVGYDAMTELRQYDLVERDGDAWVATDLADVAAWLADELEAAS